MNRLIFHLLSVHLSEIQLVSSKNGVDEWRVLGKPHLAFQVHIFGEMEGVYLY
jgi:hypothetical protein